MTILLPLSGSMVTGERLINCLIQGTLIALFVSALFRLKIFYDSATRFAIWFVTLVAILILPFLGSTRPSKFLAASAPHINVPGRWFEFAFAAWVAISLFGLLRVFIGLIGLRALRRRTRELSDAELPIEARSVLEGFSSRRDIRICVSDEINAPTAVGFMRPAVLVPEWALHELTGKKLRSVLLHELGHLRRWDDWTNLLQKLVRAVFFFHPAIWWIDSRLCLEREMACDDLVVAESNDAHGYAECLVSLAERSMVRRGFALAVAAVGRVRQMTLRLGRILDKGPRRPVPRVSLASLSLVAIFAIAASAHLPMLVIIENGPAPAAMLPKAGGRVATGAAKFELTSDSPQHAPANIIPAVMNVPGTRVKSGHKVIRAAAIRAGQRGDATRNPRMMRASLNSQHGQSMRALFVVIEVAQPELSRVRDMVRDEPYAATLICGSGPGARCTLVSSDVVQFTLYRSSAAIRSEVVATVI